MTTDDLWFTRARLRKNAPDVAPLINTLLNDGERGRVMNTAHRLLWTLMPEEVRQVSDRDSAAFLWRAAPEKGEGNTYYLLGPKPRHESAFFSIETKCWAPAFSVGDRLEFDIVVNATVDRMVDPAKGRKGRQRVDLLMDAMFARENSAVADVSRAELRRALADDTLRAWWERQGAANGFAIAGMHVVDYATLPLDESRARGRRKGQLGIARLAGSLDVRDSAAFGARVARGFGRAKAFGCGLLLLKRAQ